MSSSIAAPRPAGRIRTISWVVALTPVWLFVITALASNALTVILNRPPEIMNVPLGVILESIALLWMLGGVAIVWRVPSPVAESVGLMVFTIPAAVIVVLTPAVIEVMQTLG